MKRLLGGAGCRLSRTDDVRCRIAIVPVFLLIAPLVAGNLDAQTGQASSRDPALELRLAADASVRFLEFEPVENVATDGEETVFLLDRSAQQVVRRDLQSGDVERIGREGGGPGEFQRLFDVVAGPGGDFWVLSGGNVRISHFASDGRLRDTYPAPAVPTHGGLSGDGEFFLAWAQPTFEQEAGGQTVGVLDPASEEFEALFPVGEAASSVAEMPEDAPDTGFLVLAVQGIGRILAGNPYTYELTVLDREGSELARVRRDVELEYPKDEELAYLHRRVEEAAREIANAGGSVPENVIEREKERRAREPKPFFGQNDIVTDGEGGIWIKTGLRVPGDSTAVDYFGPGEQERTEKFVLRDRVLAIDVRGRYLVALVERLGPEALGRKGLDVYRIERGIE